MTEHQKKVLEFHKVMGSPIGDKPSLNDVKLRARLILEEAVEFAAACGLDCVDISNMVDEFTYDVTYCFPGKLDQAVDALADLEYVVNGAYVAFGVDGEPIFNEVHRSNMTKLGPDGKPIKNGLGKIKKPDTWSPPDIVGELKKQGL